MSDMSNLSHEYASSADFSRSLNTAVLMLKKRFSRSETTTAESDLQNALMRLRSTLSSFIARLDDSASGQEDVSIPEDIFERIVDEHRGSLPDFQQELARVLSALSGHLAIQRDDLEFLDGLCVAADASASATFRKLWRR